MADAPGSLGGYIARALRHGVSQAQTMRELRQGGAQFSDATFRSLWGEIEHAQALRGEISTLRTDRRIPERLISPIEGGNRGEFLHRFDVMLRRRGEREVLTTHVSVKSREQITPNAAARLMLEKFGENEDQYGSYVVDWIVAAVNEFQG